MDVVIKGIVDDSINKVIENIYDINSLKNIPNIAYKDSNKIIVTEHKIIIYSYNK